MDGFNTGAKLDKKKHSPRRVLNHRRTQQADTLGE
jgi:hypothetical protein